MWEWKAPEWWGSLAGRSNAVTPIVQRPHLKVCLDVIHVSQWVCVISITSAEYLYLPDFFAAFMQLWLTEPMNGLGEDERKNILHLASQQRNIVQLHRKTMLSISVVGLQTKIYVQSCDCRLDVLDRDFIQMQIKPTCHEDNGKQIVVCLVSQICSIIDSDTVFILNFRSIDRKNIQHWYISPLSNYANMLCF